MISAVISRLVILLFGTLYPAYASYKAVKTKNVKEYVKWMMYWIVFAFFSCFETFTDVMFAFWFPFYYEIKIILVVWLLSPATKGSSILYRKFVHPKLAKHEKEIDEYISRAKEQGYKSVMKFGVSGLNFASQFIVQTALRGGGTFMDQLKRSYSLSDISERPLQMKMEPMEVRALQTSALSEDVDKDETDNSIYVDDSETDAGDLHTHSSGYSSTSALNKLIVEDVPGVRTRSKSQKTGSTKKAVNPSVAVYATLPRSSKRTKKRPSVIP
ncbi:hypothetical protein CHUAL_009202 [Chamberlinius hualienensis]